MKASSPCLVTPETQGVTRCNARCNKSLTVLDSIYTFLLHRYTYSCRFPCKHKIKIHLELLTSSPYRLMSKIRCNGVTTLRFKRHPQQKGCYTLVTPCYTLSRNTPFTPSPTQNGRCNSHE